VPSKQPSPNGRSRVPGPRVPTPSEAGPSLLGTALLFPVFFLWVLAFTDRPIAIATVPGILALLAIIERCRSLKSVLLWVGLFGAAGIGTGYHWLAQTVRDFGGLGVPASYGVLGVFGIAGMVHGWVFAVIYRSLLASGRRPHPVLTAVVVVTIETLPIRLFPFMIGHSVGTVAPLRQSAEWGGVPGVTFATCCLLLAVYEWLRSAFEPAGPPSRPKAAAVSFAIGLALYGWGMWRYADVKAEEEAAERTLRVGIVQPNVGSGVKRDAENYGGDQRLRNVAAYAAGSRKAAAAGAELIVWPETAITDSIPLRDPLQTNQFLRGRDYGFLNSLGEKAAFLVGLYEQALPEEAPPTREPVRDRRYNVAALRQPGDVYAPWTRYRKVFLIPFGETMPFGWMEDRLPQRFKMLPGEMPQPLLETAGLTFAPFLCYEGILPDHVLDVVAGRRPDVIVSLANDSWFGDTWEPWQHLNFTIFRAVEHRAPIVRATNTGVSAFVSATGDVTAHLGVGVEGVLVTDLPIVSRDPTLYVRLGHRFPLLCWILTALAWLGAMIRRR
jgi:apolipoprotein N-acyltransferase